MAFLNVILLLLFSNTSLPGIIFYIIYIIGLWKMLPKSGIKGWWAIVPFAREYMLSRCAGRVPEGRILVLLEVADFLPGAASILLAGNRMSEFDELLVFLFIVEFAAMIGQFFYWIRIGKGLTDVYDVSKWWILLFCRF